MTEAVYSVSEINNFIKHILEQEPELRNLQVVGEISNFKRYPSGHCYFTLKDAGAVLKCVMFRSKAVNLRFQPQNGDTVVAVGRLAVYERDGVYQLYTDLLLQQGDYTRSKKRANRKTERIASIYWSVVTAGYLRWSFLSNAWHISWVVWPVAGVLFGAVSALIQILSKEE